MIKNIYLLCFFSAINFAGFSKSDFLKSNSLKSPLGQGPCHAYSKYKINNGNWSTPSKTEIDNIFSPPDTIVLNANDSISFNIYFDQTPCIDYLMTMNPPQWFFNGTIIEGESTPDLTAKDSGEYKLVYYEFGSRIIYTHIFNIVKPSQTKENKLSCALYCKYSINGTWSIPQKSEFHATYFSHSDTINLNSSDTITFNFFKDGTDCGSQTLNTITSCHWYFNDTIPIEGVSTGIYKTTVPGSYKMVYGDFPNQYTFNFYVIKNSGGTSTLPECKLYSQYQVNGIWSSPLPCTFTKSSGMFQSSSVITLGLTDSVNIKVYMTGPACGYLDTNSVSNKGYWSTHLNEFRVSSEQFSTNISGDYYFYYSNGNNGYRLNFKVQKPSGSIGCDVYSQFNINGTASTPSMAHFNSNQGYFMDTISVYLSQNDTVLLSVYKQGNYCISQSYLDVCQWSYSRGLSPTYSLPETSSTYKAFNPGYYTVVYGYTYIITFHINGTPSNNFPYATINAGPDQSICKDSNIQLAGIVSGSNNITWIGGFGSFLPNRNTLNATYVPSSADIAAGSINLSLAAVSSYINESSSDNIKLTFLPTPIINASADQTVSGSTPAILNGSVLNATGGIWTSSGSGTFTPNNTTLNASYIPSTGDVTAGSVTLILTSTGSNCIKSDTTLLIVNAISAGLTGRSSLDLFNISPNPTSDILHIDISQNNEDISISLFNTLGEKQMDKKLGGSSTIDMKNFSKGLYYLILSNGREQRVVKIVKD